jgi:UDP-N-acetylmuramoyl-L-alanyl-D-glutamate--2,6-diaminopimelate ligase
MGAAAGRLADLAVVTSDNPRTEDPGRIIAEIVGGLDGLGRRRLSAAEAVAGEAGYVVEPDRRAAIELAVACAREGDAVLLAGKGHEAAQIVGAERRRFDDAEEARRALRGAAAEAGRGQP